MLFFRMSTQPTTYLTPEEYLEIERKRDFRSEYFDGQMYAMAGATLRHGRIVSNINASLHAQLRKRPCSVYATDVRVSVSRRLYTYPDLVVVCNDQKIDDRRDSIENPTVIVEVLSPSTESHDRGLKLENCRKLGSLKEYLLIAQDRPHVEQYARQADNRWLLSEVSQMSDTIVLPSIECTLALADMYEKVDWAVS